MSLRFGGVCAVGASRFWLALGTWRLAETRRRGLPGLDRLAPGERGGVSAVWLGDLALSRVLLADVARRPRLLGLPDALRLPDAFLSFPAALLERDVGACLREALVEVAPEEPPRGRRFLGPLLLLFVTPGSPIAI